MKKTIALFLVLAMMLSLASCGSKSATASEPSKSTQSQAKDTESDSKSKSDAKTSEPVKEIAFEEIIVVDNEECTIKITDVDPGNAWGFALKVFFENKSADKSYMFSVEEASVDGVDSDPFFATTIAPGKKGNDNISFSDSTLEALGVSFSDIYMVFEVSDSEDWSADPVAFESIHIYPFGKENAIKYVREPQPTDTVLVDNEYVTAIVTGYNEEDFFGYAAEIFLVNKTDTHIMFSVDDASVNGYMADPFWATSVLPNSCVLSHISWSDTTFEENDIEVVEEIEFTFEASDADDWMADPFVEEVFTLNP